MDVFHSDFIHTHRRTQYIIFCSQRSHHVHDSTAKVVKVRSSWTLNKTDSRTLSLEALFHQTAGKKIVKIRAIWQHLGKVHR
jgi:hypothetical protein